LDLSGAALNVSTPPLMLTVAASAELGRNKNVVLNASSAPKSSLIICIKCMTILLTNKIPEGSDPGCCTHFAPLGLPGE
jgi:hypothetical protein